MSSSHVKLLLLNYKILYLSNVQHLVLQIHIVRPTVQEKYYGNHLEADFGMDYSMEAVGEDASVDVNWSL